MADTIPKDLEEKARLVYDELGRGSAADEKIIARAMLSEREYWSDKADGLASDLDSAIEVMAKRVWGSADTESMGEWLLRNYRHHKAVKAGFGDSLPREPS